MVWVYIICFHISTIELKWDVMDGVMDGVNGVYDEVALFVLCVELYVLICQYRHKPITSCLLSMIGTIYIRVAM